ncbi:MAG: hypothetical protein M3364_06025 [Actinomycetota bacterium]|nr:hypothetical protein [Actinomycetota bacterium]
MASRFAVGAAGIDPASARAPRAATGLVFDGELVAWWSSEPYFPLVCRRVLNCDMSVPLTFVIFDLLSHQGADLTLSPMASADASSSV